MGQKVWHCNTFPYMVSFYMPVGIRMMAMGVLGEDVCWNQGSLDTYLIA